MKAIEVLLINVIYFIIVNFVALFFKLLCGHTFLRKSFLWPEREYPHSPAKMPSRMINRATAASRSEFQRRQPIDRPARTGTWRVAYPILA